jgi:hypothetical protein
MEEKRQGEIPVGPVRPTARYLSESVTTARTRTPPLVAISPSNPFSGVQVRKAPDPFVGQVLSRGAVPRTRSPGADLATVVAG